MLWSHKKCQQIGDERGMSRVRVKNSFAQPIADKILGAKWTNAVKLDRKRKVWYLFLSVF